MPVLNVFSRNRYVRLGVSLLLLSMLISVTACDLSRNQLKPDREANLEVQDYRDALAPRLPEDGDGDSSKGFGGIPSLKPYISTAESDMKPMPVVSISVNQTVPLRDVFFELAKQADYDLELDPRIKGAVIFTAREKPFDQVVARLAEVAGLRYRFVDEVLRVELDTPYHKAYKIDYLSYIRENSGSISNNISVVTGEGADTGSQFKASTKSEADFWGELETNISQILDAASAASLKTRKDPRITVTDENPPVEAVTPAGAGQSGETSVEVQPPQAVLKVDALPLDEEDSPAGSGGSAADNEKASFALNKQAGIISVYATEKQHKEIKAYLDLLRRAVTAQVLIEAKILEVELSDEYAAGIDWRLFPESDRFGISSVSNGGGIGAMPAFNTPITNPATVFDVFYTRGDFSILLNMVSRFGVVHALASPRLTVLNNQSAVMNVANNRVFFELDVDSSVEDGLRTTEVDSEIRNVPEGVLINVQPSIDLESKTISMSIRPTITRIQDTVNDPGVALAVALADIDDAGLTSPVPVVNVQEIDSVIRMKSGQAVVMGGLLQDRTQSTVNGVPVLSEVPVMGSLFRNQVDQITKTELVIFLKATILDDGDNVHDTDKDLYRIFSADRRPLKL